MQTIDEVREPLFALDARIFEQFIKTTERRYIMKKKTTVLTVLLVLCCFQPIVAAEYETYDIPENLTKNIPMDEKKALQLLIHINWIASRISHKETVLEDEYKQINVGNLDLSYLKDDDAIASLKSLSTAITNARKKRGDEKMAEHVKDAQLKNAFFSSAPNPVAIVSKDWRAMAFVAVQSAFSWYMNYQAIKREVKLQYEQEMWKLEKEDMENVNTFYNEMLDHQTRVVTRYKIDDMFRVTDGDFRRLAEYLEEMDDKAAYEMLRLSQKRYMLSAFYWYHRGVLAYKLKDYDEAMKCFRTFQRIHVPFIRRDKMAALVAQGIIDLLGKVDGAPDKKEIKNQLRVIEKNAQPDDWELYYFVATVYFDLLKDYRSAEDNIKNAMGHLTLLYKRDLTDYLKWLGEEKKLPFVKWRKFRKENVPPSSENLAQCRAFLFQILLKIDEKSVIRHSEYFWKQYDVSDMERLMMASSIAGAVSSTSCTESAKGFLETTLMKVGLSGGAKMLKSDKLSNEDNEMFSRDVFAIDVDYDFNDEFWVFIPLRWVYFMPTDITFSLYGEDGAELHCAKENVNERRVVIRDKRPVLAIEIDTDGVKKLVDRQKVFGYSLNFNHPFSRTRVYVKKFDYLKKVAKASDEELAADALTIFGDGVGLGPEAITAISENRNEYIGTQIRPVLRENARYTVTLFKKPEGAMDYAHQQFIDEIANPLNANVKSERLHGFLISYENPHNGTCTVIDFSDAFMK